MKVKGICKDCMYRWQWGAKGQPQHLWCTKQSRVIKNHKMQSCKDYEKTNKEQLKIIRWRASK